MSLLPAYMSGLWKCYEQMHKEDLESIDLALLSVDPLTCHISVLPFLAWEADININGFTEEQLRKIIEKVFETSRYAGSVYSIKNILNSLGNLEFIEYFSENPYVFNVKMLLDSDIPSINKYVYLIEKYKNIRSQYEFEFNIETLSTYKETSASSISADFFQGLSIEKQASLSTKANSNFRSDFVAILGFDKTSKYAATASSSFDIETSRNYFDVDRFSNIKNQAIANMRIDFSYNNSDVMHLPIPPIMLNTSIKDMSVAIFDIDFSSNGSDVFHLNYEKNYEVAGGASIDGFGVMDMEFYDSGILFDATATTLVSNENSVNLDF